MKHLIRRLRAEEHAFTLVEAVISSALLLLIIGAALSMLDSGTKSERVSQARNDAQVSLRGAMTQMTRELRQAISVAPSSNQSLLDMQTLIGGVEHHIVYQVVGEPPSAKLQRAVDGGTPTQLADRIVAPQAFCYQYNEPDCLATSPPASLTAIRISLQISPVVFSSGTITLATDVQLRNVASG
jgi:hypothetical protein